MTESEILEVNLLENYSNLKVIETDEKIELILKALSSKTRRNILRHIQSEPMDVSKIASNLTMTEANISAQIKILEEAELIKCDYSSGKHGVRKISCIKYNQLLLKFM
ncbi:MAG: helix-turn-helix transcriptional regulator [Candidatus Lokiarchaeota archaeon]|nr:helix-turn-helix transcriptional regulator [Candidatus Lokiarchaeota archaeon]